MHSIFGRLRARMFTLALLALGIVSLAPTSVFASDPPSVWTDKPDYGATEVVQVDGRGFDPGAVLTIAITRPDGSVIRGDGTGTPGTDTVVVAADGALSYQYALSGIDSEGNSYKGQEETYLLNVLDASGVVLASTTFTDSHFRFGHLTWREIGTNQAEFTYTFAQGGSATIGAAAGSHTINFGDSSSASVAMTVTDVHSADNWYLSKGTVTHQYASGGPFTAFQTGGDRIAELSNSPEALWRVEALVDFSTSGSPVSLLPAIVDCPLGGTCTFTIGASQPDLHDITYRLATSGESSATQPTGSSINSTTGVYSLDTSGKADGQLWTTQVILEDRSAGGSVLSTSAIDFIIRVVDASDPASFDVPPTPANGSVLGVGVGGTLNFSVKATDADSATVTIDALGVPASATFDTQTGTNPGTRTFSWTPTVSDIGITPLVFTASDGETSVNHSISINVSKIGVEKSLTHISGPNPPQVGATSVYEISIAVSIPGAASGSVDGVSVSDPLPTGVTFVGNATSSVGTISYTSPDVDWASIGTLAPGDSESGSFRVSVTPVSGDVGKTLNLNEGAVATGTEQSTSVALTSLSNTLSTSAVISNPIADLGIAKTASPTIALIGQNITYTLTATNNGPETATSVTITDVLPAGVSLVSAAGCTGTTTITCTVSSLANGASAAFDIVVTAPNSFGTISNTASVSAASPTDNVSGNDSVTLVTAVGSPPGVPGLTTWGMGALALMLGAGAIFMRRRRVVA